MDRELTIGAGAGYAGDRVEPAIELIEDAGVDYIVFECLAERTIANAQAELMDDRSAGYSPRLAERMRRALSACVDRGTVLITNMGAANPEAAAARTAEIADDLGLTGLSIATVTGSDVSGDFDAFAPETFEGESSDEYRSRCVSAHAYMGVDGIVTALDHGADVVITDRVADPSLFLAPMVYEFGWDPADPDDADVVGQGVLAAHLLECAGQVTGGYFADPGYKDVDGLDRLGFPYAAVDEEGSVRITKTPTSGGEVTVRTCTEQLLYEVHDPSEYLTPDAVADFSNVSFERIGDDDVRAAGATSTGRPPTLKVAIGFEDGFVGEGRMTYAGAGARDRAALAGKVVERRLAYRDLPIDELRVDLVGIDALHGPVGRRRGVDPYEVGVRVTGRCQDRSTAEAIAREVQTLYTNGPAGGGGARMRTERVIGVVSTLIDRSVPEPSVAVTEV